MNPFFLKTIPNTTLRVKSQFIARLRFFEALFLLLCLLLPMDSSAKPQTLERCLQKSGGINDEAECRDKEIRALESQRYIFEKAIRAELTRCTPLLLGYDYSAAVTSFDRTQLYWRNLPGHACDGVVGKTYGVGTGISEAVLSCRIEILVQNNGWLKNRLSLLRETRKNLENSQLYEAKQITCK